MSADIGGTRDTLKLREDIESNIARSDKMSKNIQALIKRAIALSTRTGRGNERKQQATLLNEDFEKFNKKYKDLAKSTEEKIDNTNVPLMTNTFESSTHYDDDDESVLAQARRRDDFLKMDNDVNFSNVIIDDREKELKDLAKEVTEVSDLFAHVAKMVDNQGLGVETIAGNISSAASHTSGGVGQLEEADKQAGSMNRTMCICAIVLTVVIALVVVIVVLIAPKPYS
eukprot:TRINITY_DN875_c0_g1_i2.p1 TRINITY_DN875_c0_g1~~TRINITY_DN875_c0_g1_i2.p1  ORF type:complete len:228 (-),score=42.58 TRINITY_DN875_c0_g1_i2:13-696(-)